MYLPICPKPIIPIFILFDIDYNLIIYINMERVFLVKLIYNNINNRDDINNI